MINIKTLERRKKNKKTKNKHVYATVGDTKTHKFQFLLRTTLTNARALPELNFQGVKRKVRSFSLNTMNGSKNEIEEGIAEEDIAEEDIAEEDIAEENIAEENIAEENIAEENIAEENIVIGRELEDMELDTAEIVEKIAVAVEIGQKIVQVIEVAVFEKTQQMVLEMKMVMVYQTAV